MKLDDIDFKILDLLQRDGRLSHAAIGKEIGLTGPSVYARIQRLERDGVINGYTILIDPEKIGRGLVAIVRVATMAPADEANAFERFVQNEPQILECFDVDGEDSYILKVRTATPQSLRKLLLKLRGIPGVNHTVTSIALQTLKELPACSVEGIEVQSTEKE